MKNRILISTMVSVLAMCLWYESAFAARRPPTFITIPARRRVVSLMHDVFRLRHVTIVAYQDEAGTENPVMHTWDGRQWLRITIDEYANAPVPEKIILVGDDKTVPSILVGCSSRAKDLQRIQTLDIAALIIELENSLKLNSRELKWLAERHGLKVTDLNAELRRYGRYGKPGAEKPMPPVETKSRHAFIPAEPELKPVAEEPSAPEEEEAPPPAPASLPEDK